MKAYMQISYSKTLEIPKDDTYYSDELFDMLGKYAHGDILEVELKKRQDVRNNKYHKKFFGDTLSHIKYFNQDKFDSIDDVLTFCKIITGHCKIIGDIAIPKSISFSEMSQEAFEEFVNKSISECKRYGYLPEEYQF